MPPPKPARELAGQADGPFASSFSFAQTAVPRRSSVTPAGPYTLTWVIGEGTGPVVDPIVARPNAFVGTPSLSGEKPASVIVTVSSALAPVANTRHAPHASTATNRAPRPIALPSMPCPRGAPACRT